MSHNNGNGSKSEPAPASEPGRRQEHHEDDGSDMDMDIGENVDANVAMEVGGDGDSDRSRREVSSARSALIQEQNELLKKKVVFVVVFGDIGRSPRMRYHAMSLAREGYLVQMIGYGGSSLPVDLETNPSIWVRRMKEPPEVMNRLPRLISYPAKIVWQWLQLAWVFLALTFVYRFLPDFILLQNPPAVPSIPLCLCYARIYRCPFIIDWHNYGYSIMALKTGTQSPIYKFAKYIEDSFGKRADFHICVTRAMKDDLKGRLGVDAVTLYDRPPSQFRSLEPDERLGFLRKLAETYPEVKRVFEPNPSELQPGILVSTTSWTEDEDFRILLSALKEYDRAVSSHPKTYPPLLVFITGKGPEKEYYEGIMKKMQVPNLKFYLPWLKHEDYPKLLACADLGVSLHTSSSGLDLPMKVVDMFGAGLPVCAMNFKAISELVRENENGMIFNNDEELASQIKDWFKISETSKRRHEGFRENVKKFQSLRWHANWLFNVAPLFES